MIKPTGTHGVCIVLLLILAPLAGGATSLRDRLPPCGDGPLPVYPETAAARPRVVSPCLAGSEEYLLALTKSGAYTTVAVTVENAALHLSYGRSKIGKGDQLRVDAADFPALARTGLHDPDQLAHARSITGRPVEEITRIGRPEQSSAIGFMAADEDIVSVLMGDDRLVRQLGLTHPELARPLFHVSNLLLAQYERDTVRRFDADLVACEYRGRRIAIQAHPTRGFQESIFNDEIQGAWDIDLRGELDTRERDFLLQRYARLAPTESDALTEALCHIHTGEMEPYYIMQYGFYEGHTAYRTDPIAIAFLFGLRSIQEIEAAMPGRLPQVLSEHFTPPSRP